MVRLSAPDPRHSSRRGFTLLELIVVVAIIGLLATLILVALRVARQRAREVRIRADVDTVRKHAELVYDRDGRYQALQFSDCANPASAEAEINVLAKDINDLSGCLTITVRDQTTFQNYCAAASLDGTTRRFCVDSTGAALEGADVGCTAEADTSKDTHCYQT